jgi:vacuolar protein sorting-associated protein 72
MAEDQERSPDNDQEMRDGSSLDSDGDSDESAQVETLVAGRSRRATAGNRLSSLIEHEARETAEADEVDLLFESDENDVEFEGADADDASDVQLDSSTDDEDQGPEAKGDDELEGEKELQKRDKAERLAKKRKQQDAFSKLGQMRKKVKIDPTSASVPTTPAARPKKKSERVSWLPTPEEGPVRQSSRRQTVQNKEATHAKMKEDMERRLHTIAVMEAAAKRKEKTKPKEMTQAERLAEAAKTEKMNSKSLNRWEEMEKKRTEEQRARLAALQNRKLDGPVVSFWSGVAKWVGDKLTQVGLHPVTQDAEKEGKGRKKKDKDSVGGDQQKKLKDKTNTDENGTPANEVASVATPTESVNLEQVSTNNHQITFAPPQGPGNFLDGIQFYVSMPPDPQPAPDLTSNEPPPTAPDVPTPTHQDSTASFQVVEPEVRQAARNLLILENFDSRSLQEKGEYSILFTNKRAASKPQNKPQSQFLHLPHSGILLTIS